MAFADQREYIAALERQGEAIRVEKEVDWDLEMGAIIRRCSETGAPAPFFQKIKDYPGHRVFGGAIANFKRAAIALGLKPDASIREIQDTYHSRTLTAIKPVVVGSAPCQEVVITGDDLDLSMFPVPMIHDGDGGRYIGTWHFLVNKDPETGWVNWGMYRLMLHNERLMGAAIHPISDFVQIMNKYEREGKRAPFAVVIGSDNYCTLSSLVNYGVGKSEVDLAGGLRQAPVELVKCKTIDLEVPANAEIILEGEVVPEISILEGPFGEYTGYRTAPRDPRLVLEVKAITHRKDPIFTMSNMGVPVDELGVAMCLGQGGGLRQSLQAAGLPVTGVFFPPEGVGGLVVVATKKPYNHVSMLIANHIFGSHFGIWVHQLIIVQDDVDPFDMKEVVHAFSTKCHPLKGMVTFPSWGNPLGPFLSLEERLWHNGGRVVFDCTWPLEWDKEKEVPVKSSFKTIYPKEIQEHVLANWKQYGFR